MNAAAGALLTSEVARAPRKWQTRKAVAYPFMLGLAVALVMRIGLGPAPLNDSLSVYWVWADQFTAQLAHGDLYPRWLAASDAGLGTPVFYFYPPIAFYVAALFGFAGFSTLTSLLATFAVGFAASGIGCWHWLRGRSNHPLLGSALFVAAPYHLLNYTDRGAVAESLATACIPLLAIGLRRLAEKRGGIVFTALAYGAMIGTHLPLALLVSIFLIAPYVIAHRRQAHLFAAALALGLAIGAIYLLPALVLAPYHDAAQLYRSANLRPPYWSLFSGNWSDASFATMFLIIGAIIAAALPALVRRDRWATLAIAVGIVVAGVIPLVWSLPLLRDVQFPFRALPIAEFALATAIARLPRDGKGVLLSAVLPLSASIVVLPGFHPPIDDLARLRAVHPDTYEYLPKGVMKAGETHTTLREVLATRVPPRVPGMIVEPHFYFPSWSCGRLEPRTQLLMHEPSCAPRIVWTSAEKLGAMISLLGALVAAIVSRRRRTLVVSRGVT